MEWWRRLRSLSVRSKVTLTVGGTVVLLLGFIAYLSFRYWQTEALAATKQQALLGARSVRTAVEVELAHGRIDEAYGSLRRLAREHDLSHARVYAPDGRMVVSTDRSEEGRRATEVWIPRATEIPPGGLIRETGDGSGVRAFLPLRIPGTAVLEVEFSVAPVKEAMDRGARLAVGLALASVLALAVIVLTMLEKEVVTPIRRLEGRLAAETSGDEAAGKGGGPRSEDELGRLESSVERLIRREQAVERLAEARHRRLEEQRGLAEVGELAAEMAHEMKRPLVTMRSAVELLEQEYRLNGRGEEMLEQVDRQLDRLAETMGDLFALARPVELEGGSLDLTDVLDGALLQLREHPAGRDLEIRREYDAELPRVRGDAHRLEQAFVNVMLNAAEAMAGEKGTLAVEAREEGGRVRVTVADTGPGIPPEEVREIMRPFYSTKPTGTGLGLPLVARVVSAHGGDLRVESTPGVGTRVHVRLPVRAAAG